MKIAVVGLGLMGGWLLQALCLALPFGALPLALLISSLIARRSLQEHVLAVARGLEAGLDVGRAAVARIVGRDPQSLDRPAVARAAGGGAANAANPAGNPTIQFNSGIAGEG